MNKNFLVPAAIASTLVGALVLTGCSDTKPSDEFTKACKNAGGKIERENDNSLSMGPVAFVAGKGGGSKPKPSKAKKVKKNKKTSKLGSGLNSKPKPKKKSDDNDFLCVKNGNVLFEEDE